jgi:hypothetical protein
MKFGMMCSVVLVGSAFCLCPTSPTLALISQPASLASAVDREAGIELVRGRGGGRAGGGRVGGGYRGGAVHRTTAAVGPRGGAVRRTTAVVGPRGNVGVRRTTVAVARPYRAWVRRPYYGRVVAGVALGTIIATSVVPTAPSSDVCWYWSNSAKTRGYWDYCS